MAIYKVFTKQHKNIPKQEWITVASDEEEAKSEIKNGLEYYFNAENVEIIKVAKRIGENTWQM